MPSCRRSWRDGFPSATISHSCLRDRLALCRRFGDLGLRPSGEPVIINKDEDFVDRWLLSDTPVPLIWIRRVQRREESISLFARAIE